MSLQLDELMTGDEVARALRVSEDTIRRWAAAGKLEVVRLNARTYRYPQTSVLALIRASAARKPTEVPR